MIVVAAALLLGETYLQRTLNDPPELTVSSDKTIASVEKCVLFDSGIMVPPLVYKSEGDIIVSYPGTNAARSMIRIRSDGGKTIVTAWHGARFVEAVKQCS